MKRHKSLYPLSHDHHHGLVQARQLCLADARNVQNSPDEAAERFIDFWNRDLQRHFQEEEEIVLPILEKYLSSDGAEFGETRTQHHEIRGLISILNRAMMDHTRIEPGLLRQLGEALRDHIRFEEHQLFPILEASVPEKALWELNERLMQGRD